MIGGYIGEPISGVIYLEGFPLGITEYTLSVAPAYFDSSLRTWVQPGTLIPLLVQKKLMGQIWM